MHVINNALSLPSYFIVPTIKCHLRVAELNMPEAVR